jgi:hypothetical protein
MALSTASIVQITVASIIFLATVFTLLPTAELETHLSYEKPHLERYPTTFIPAFGLGTWQSDNDKVANAVVTALESNYRHIDAAAIYRKPYH